MPQDKNKKKKGESLVARHQRLSSAKPKLKLKSNVEAVVSSSKGKKKLSQREIEAVIERNKTRPRTPAKKKK